MECRITLLARKIWWQFLLPISSELKNNRGKKEQHAHMFNVAHKAKYFEKQNHK